MRQQSYTHLADGAKGDAVVVGASPHKSLLSRISDSLHPPNSNVYVGKTPADWGRIIAYLFVFYVLLLGFTAGMFMVFLEGVINEDQPYRTGQSSVLSLKPSLSMRPIIDFKTALIAYNMMDRQSYMTYVQNMRAFLQFYEDDKIVTNEYIKDCPLNSASITDPERVCAFRLFQLGACNKERNFGYEWGQPCVLLKLNRVYGWLPRVRNQSETSDILVQCAGLNKEDVEGFGQLRYYPNVTINKKTYGVFRSLYYPFLTQQAYRQPLVALEFLTPKRNRVLMVQCSLVNLNDNGDPIKFELLID